MRPIRAILAIIALSVVAGAVAFAIDDASPGRTATSKPIRALAVGDDADARFAGSGGGAPAEVEGGPLAAAHVSAPVTRLPAPARGPEPWVRKELRIEDEIEASGGEVERPALEPDRPPAVVGQPDDALQTTRGAAGISIVQQFKGLGAKDNPYKLVPPDTNGDVSADYFVQMVNTVLAVYDTADGSLLAGPALMSDLFDVGTQKLCATHDDGDPVVLYDQLADRWMISQFALNFNANKYAMCIAVSTSADPTGTWYAYQFFYPKSGILNDYPKFGLWPDGYYASFNQFNGTSFNWAGAGVIVYERTEMLAGDPAAQQYVNLKPVDINLGGFLPSDLDGPTPPPMGAPNVFAMFDPDEWGFPDDRLQLWEFAVDWAMPENSSFAHADNLSTANFNPFVCKAWEYDCVPQKGTTNKVDALWDRLMYRLQYRNDSDQTLVVTHTVRRSGKRAGIRWYDLTDTGSGGAYEIADQGTYAPDSKKSRWMPSAALNGNGDMAVGYSISAPGMYPSINVAGRDMLDPAGMLTFDKRVFTGKGSEKGKYGRWGDYASMSVDPSDDCSFWFTTQYYQSTSQWNWRTRIVHFELPGCP